MVAIAVIVVDPIHCLLRDGRTLLRFSQPPMMTTIAVIIIDTFDVHIVVRTINMGCVRTVNMGCVGLVGTVGVVDGRVCHTCA